MRGQRLKRYNFYIGERQYERLREVAEWEGRSMSELLRGTLEAFTIERLAEKRRKIREAGGLDLSNDGPSVATIAHDFIEKERIEGKGKRRISLAVPPNRITK